MAVGKSFVVPVLAILLCLGVQSLSASGQTRGRSVGHRVGSGSPAKTFARPQSNASSRSRLPAGRSYYQGRYYGNFNNRFYGPQYGYF